MNACMRAIRWCDGRTENDLRRGCTYGEHGDQTHNEGETRSENWWFYVWLSEPQRLNYRCYYIYMSNIQTRHNGSNECFSCLMKLSPERCCFQVHTIHHVPATLSVEVPNTACYILSASAANNKIDLVTKADIFVAVFFFFFISIELLCAAVAKKNNTKINRSECTTSV